MRWEQGLADIQRHIVAAQLPHRMGGCLWQAADLVYRLSAFAIIKENVCLLTAFLQQAVTLIISKGVYKGYTYIYIYTYIKYDSLSTPSAKVHFFSQKIYRRSSFSYQFLSTDVWQGQWLRGRKCPHSHRQTASSFLAQPSQCTKDSPTPVPAVTIN